MNAFLARANLRLSRADLIRLAASFILSLLLWGWVTQSQDPSTDRTFSGIPVTTGELPAPLQVVGTISDVTVRVTGPRSIVSDITSDDVSASLDLDGIVAPGEYTRNIKIETPRGVWTKTSTPSRVPILVQETVTKQFVVDADVSGNLDATRQISASITDASEVTVVGPSESVARVTRVIAPVEVENQTRDFTSAVTPLAIDANGQTIPEVVISPEIVTVDVAIEARGKRVAVITQIDGDPAQGYELVDRTINPDTVLVDGPANLVNGLIAVSTEPIDISGATETQSKRVRIIGLPDGVRVIDTIDESVDVVIQIRQQGVRQPLPAQAVEIINLAPGLTVQVSPEAVALTLVASEATLGELTAADVSIKVNVAGLGPGTYTLRPIVALPPNVTWVGSDPELVTVVIRAESTPVAPSPAAATPTPQT